MIEKFGNFLFDLSLFFLPWQTAFIVTTARISGEPSPYGAFAVYVVEVMLLLAFVVRGRRMNPRMQSLSRALYFFLAAFFFSLSASSVLWVGWFRALHVVSASVLFLLLVDDRTDTRRVLVVFLLGLLIPIGIGWFQVLTGSSPSSTILGIAAKDAFISGMVVVETQGHRLLRAYGTFPHPNVFGGYVAFAMLGLTWLTQFVRLRTQVIVAMFASGLFAATLIVTFSRSAWVGLLLASCVMIGWLWRRHHTPPRRCVWIMTVAAFTVFLTAFFFRSQVLSRFDSSGRLEAISLEERASQYETFGEIFWSSPILGVGPGAYTFVLERLHPGQPVWSYQPIHNVYLLILAELGMVGFIAFFYFLFSLYRRIIDLGREPAVVAAIMMGLLFFVSGLFDHYLWTLWPGIALSALALGMFARHFFGSEPPSESVA